MEWWASILPLQGAPSKDDLLLGRTLPLSTKPDAPDPELTDDVLLIRQRLSRIYFLCKFFDYPISLKWQTFRNLGWARIFKIALSYGHITLFPIREEKSLEDFFINRFGGELYRTFFKDYTEKVWGVPCEKIKPEWGAQRVKGLSIVKTIAHAVASGFKRDNSILQKEVETSLIGQFLYPKYGPGQLWEKVASLVQEKGGEIFLNHKVVRLEREGNSVVRVYARREGSPELMAVAADYVFSTMPVKDLVTSMIPPPPENVREVASRLVYRDFITVGVLFDSLKIKNDTKFPSVYGIVPDNWIYIQERDVKLGRVQVFNNWSPYLVKSPDKIWLGLEYFTNEGDELWSKTDREMAEFAISELRKIGFIEHHQDALDYVVIRTPKAYPAYWGGYSEFERIRDYVDAIENLFLIGRNGMHRYNNQDHSMLTAMEAVKNVRDGVLTKENIWKVNAEDDYHEKK